MTDTRLTTQSLIQWPRAKYWDRAWNPIIGCRPISPACDNCYARTATERFRRSFAPHLAKRERPPRKGVVFCGNMTDLFGDWLNDGWLAEDAHIDLITRTLGYSRRGATYLWLTKRPRAMCNALERGVMIPSDDPDRDIPFRDCEFCNQFFGFTAENQEWYDRRFKVWRSEKPEWANGWLSAEPLLGPIDLHLDCIAPEDLPFKWIVVGCESGAKRRPCEIEWVDGIICQALARDIPVFVKQLDIDGKCETDIEKFPKDFRIRQVPWVGDNGKGGV